MNALPPLALYIHVPWCVRKCPYCDFNSHAKRGELPEAEYVAALLRDLEQDLPLVWGRTVSSIFFGGGTPSLLGAAAIGAILEGVAARLRLSPGLEVTLEANPGTAEHDRFEGYRAAGVNRISFGIQSFDDGCLARLGRIHDAAQAVRAVQQAQDAGFDNLNLDLMYALPGQDLAMAEADVERAIALAPAHISHYQLTLEPNTLFHARPPKGLPDDDLAFTMQESCQARLAAAGYEQYEVSAYARAGKVCQHNLNYWRFGDYLGIGAGAHGKLSLPAEGRILRRWKCRHPQDYLRRAGSPQAIGGEETLPAERLAFEFMLNALRLGEGFGLELFEARTGQPAQAILPTLERLRGRGLMACEGGRWRPTPFGARFLNDVIAAFLPDPRRAAPGQAAPVGART
ncbi:MAG: YggW family oxidoreductase [Lysobacteraceae bacterium]|nr:MAG: YggW family oxidoreductase [Xanthomonadaceae bacterium]